MPFTLRNAVAHLLLATAVVLTASQSSSSVEATTTATSTTTYNTCGKLKGCYIRDLVTGTETLLSTTTPYLYPYTAGTSRYSIRCDIEPGSGKVDEMKFTFLPTNTFHRSWRAPYWIDGSNGDWIEPADFLASCGSKTLSVSGKTWRSQCFTNVQYELVGTCATDCTYDLTAPQGKVTATVTKNSLTVNYQGVQPNTVYTTWIDFQSRATGQLSADYPVPANADIDLSKSGPAMGRGVAPAFATTDPVYEGMRLDMNSVKTDAYGNGKMVVQLDYNLLQKKASPVVAAVFTTQGDNVTGGGWLRRYESPIAGGPSSQQLDANGVPMVMRATAVGLTMVGHFKPFTHGHNPGVGGVDHFMGAMGDFPAHCLMA